ncbi:MAG: type II/IV secretion system protein [Candidatus Nealsonbacteria bacterium]|nr:type II/IV secretion system protein [Candidatus Nealsonbacteria bacterium]
MPEVAKKITGSIEIPATLLEKSNSLSDFKKELERSLSLATTEILEVVLAGALGNNASDIHLEPESEKTKLRLRLDGILQDVFYFPKEIYSGLLSRIKLLSGIKLNIADRPQDGRFSAVLEKETIENRVSTLPAENGESIVIRVLNPKSLISLEELGLRPDLLSLFSKELKRPNGMIIVTGPTGSGKTTTLYAFLKKIQKPEIKIITIEDPIEYRLPGISQTQTAPEKGYDFASGLRSIVRQDPDVILVGEIRDLETANIGLQASLTGHLVLTTLHTNDAAGTLARLINLGAKPADIGPAINLAIAQRLVRKVCPKCAKLEKPSPETLKKIKDSLKGLPKGVNFPPVGAQTKISKSQGCKSCNFTGYRGRVGIFEALLIDAAMEKFILQNPSIAALKEEAINKGRMTTMTQDGLFKILEGVTTFEELERVMGE